jgi:hypothetical protein
MTLTLLSGRVLKTINCKFKNAPQMRASRLFNSTKISRDYEAAGNRVSFAAL